jgi:benzil reductase ((S)-benzoin forming)
MKTYIIVGVSTGIGLSLAEHFLNTGHRVIGIGRKSSIQNPNYSFHQLDLSDENAVHNFTFPKVKENLVFIYNSGVLGEVKPIFRQSEMNAKNVFQINYLAAVALTQKVLKLDFLEQIIYISSGAAKRAIPSWAQYCASKAALDMFAETLQLELQQEDKSIVGFGLQQTLNGNKPNFLIMYNPLRPGNVINLWTIGNMVGDDFTLGLGLSYKVK